MAQGGWPTTLPSRASKRNDARTAVGLILSASAIGIGDIFIDDNSVLLGVLAVFPFAAAASVGPKATGIVGIYSVILALLLGAPDDVWGTVDHAARVTIVAVSTALGVRSSANREKREHALFASEARFREFFRAAPVAMAAVVLDESGLRLVGGNRALENLLGRQSRAPRPFDDAMSAQDRQRLQSAVRSALADLPSPAITVAISGDGGQVWVSVAAAAMAAGGEPSVVLLHMQDVTERVQAQEQLWHRTLYDVLTGLPNRDVLLDRLGQSLARDALAHALTAVLFVDLDQFKAINDRYGHVTGDRVLVTTAHRIQTLLRPTDTAARVGGDEFVVLCSGLHDDEAAWDVARRIQEVLADPISLGTTSIATSASIGIALASASGTSPDQLVRNADFAMYQAKQASRAGIALFDDRIHQEAANRMELEQALRQAVFQSQFVLHYQPLVDLVSGSLIGVEALLRWEHPERGLLQPETFIDIAEKSGLIVPIGNWVVHEASRQWAKWRDENGRSIDIAINVSAQQLGHPGFAATLSNALLTTGADPTHMLIEITESTFLDSSWAVTTELDKLTALGVQLVVDDFGTGYSSLLSLKRFTVSQIKVDRGFVAGLGRRAEDRVITSAILRLGQELGLTTVAEGVETPEQMFALRELGCQHAQGYLFAAAQPASDVLELLDRRWYVG